MIVNLSDPSCIFQDSWVLVICQQYSYRSMRKELNQRHCDTLLQSILVTKVRNSEQLIQGQITSVRLEVCVSPRNASTAMLVLPSPGVNPECASERSGPEMLVESSILQFCPFLNMETSHKHVLKFYMPQEQRIYMPQAQ